MIQAITVILFFFTITSLKGMTDQDEYLTQPIPSLYTHVSFLNNTTLVSQDETPFIQTITTKKLHSSYFSIELLKYQSDSKEQSMRYDPTTTQTIIDNRDHVVIAQKNGDTNTVLIPIKQEDDADHIIIRNPNLLALALAAGSAHFKIRDAQIVIDDQDIHMWEQLFEGQNNTQNKNPEIAKEFFSLNFVQSNIKNILTLANRLRNNIDVEKANNILSQYQGQEQSEHLNTFLITGQLEEQETQHKTIVEENLNNDDPHPLNYTAWYYAKLKRAQSNLYNNFFAPIKRWYNYLYDSYQMWKRLLF